jgi:Protein of unknown function (DUF3263)
MASESPHDDATFTPDVPGDVLGDVTADLPEQRNAQPSEAAEAFLPRQSDGGSTAPERAERRQESPGGGLSERDRAVLTFEKQHWKYAGSKEQAIRDRFGISANRYYQVLNALLDRPEALEFEPVVVGRLRRRREVRQRARSNHPRP